MIVCVRNPPLHSLPLLPWNILPSNLQLNQAQNSLHLHHPLSPVLSSLVHPLQNHLHYQAQSAQHHHHPLRSQVQYRKVKLISFLLIIQFHLLLICLQNLVVHFSHQVSPYLHHYNPHLVCFHLQGQALAWALSQFPHLYRPQVKYCPKIILCRFTNINLFSKCYDNWRLPMWGILIHIFFIHLFLIHLSIIHIFLIHFQLNIFFLQLSIQFSHP